jgi:hypothetical protein
MWVRVASRRYQGSLVVNPMWANWVEASMAGPGVPGSAQAPPLSATATASSWRSQNSAALGSPVVPEVNTMATGRSGSGPRTGARRPSPAAARAATSAGSSSTSAGSARATSVSCSGGASRGLIPAVIAPALAAAA